MPNTWLSSSLWPAIRIKYICSECFSGGTPDTTNSSYWNNGTIPWIASGELQNCDVNNATNYITIKGLSNSSARIIRKNSVAVAMTGATCANVGYINFETSANQSVYAYVMKSNQNARFAYYSLIAMRDEILSKQNGGAQAGINGAVCKNLYIPKLDLQKQEQVVNYLDKKVGIIDKLIANINQQIEDLKQCKMSLITETVTKGLNKNVFMKESGVEMIGKIPIHWEVNKIKYISRCDRQLLPENTRPNTQIHYIDIGSVTGEQGITHVQDLLFADSPSRARKIVTEGDTIISTVRTYLRAITYISKIYDKYICSTGFAVITPNKTLCKKFVYYFCQSEPFVSTMDSISKGVSYPAVTSQELIKTYICIPPVSEQITIVDYLDKKCKKIDKLLQIKRQKIEELTKYKKSLIYECVTGKKEVL